MTWEDEFKMNIRTVEDLAEFVKEFGELTDDDKTDITGKTKKVASNQPVGGKGDGEGEGPYFEGVSKEDCDLAKIGSEMANWSNKQRGLATATA